MSLLMKLTSHSEGSVEAWQLAPLSQGELNFTEPLLRSQGLRRELRAKKGRISSTISREKGQKAPP